MNRNFNTWFKTFKDSIANWRYYTDFDKVVKNVGNIKIEPLRERIDELVNKRLRGELSRCHNCPMHCC